MPSVRDEWQTSLRVRRARCAAASLAALLVLAACTSIPRIPVRTTYAGEPLHTTVDSALARYYLEDHLHGRRGNPDLDATIDALTQRHAAAPPDSPALRAIAHETSVDFAAIFFAERLLRDDCNRALNRAFSAALTNPTPLDARRASDFLVLFVPGWDYVDNGHATGADFAAARKLAAAHGLENRLVPLPPTGSVAQNADAFAAEVRRHAGAGKTILVASASSAGPAVHFALGGLLGPDERRHVKAWLNLGGILQGTPLIDFMQTPPQSWLFDGVAWYNGWTRDALTSMGTREARARFAALPALPDVLVVNYVGIPLSGQLGRFSRDKYPLLAGDGPNDGIGLVADVIAPDSLSIVALGSDHFFADDPQIEAKTLALMNLMLAWTNGAGDPQCAVPGRPSAVSPPL